MRLATASVCSGKNPIIPDSPDGLGRQDQRPRKHWQNCQFLLSPVGSVRIRLLDPAYEFDFTIKIGARSWPNAISSGESGVKSMARLGQFITHLRWPARLLPA